jgi:hypothetical protein
MLYRVTGADGSIHDVEAKSGSKTGSYRREGT